MTRLGSGPAGPSTWNPPALTELALLTEHIGQQLERNQQLGLLSITVLRRDTATVEDAWRDYDAVQREITVFLTRYSSGNMRGTDTVLDPAICGNSFVVLLGPPRVDRVLCTSDTARVQRRLLQALNSHLADVLPGSAVERFGVYVGAALMRHEPAVQCRRIVNRCLEESLADAMGQRKAEVERYIASLERVLQDETIRSVYQPLVDLDARAVIGYEALSRISGERHVPPDRLLRTAHANGSLWRLERICRRRALEGLPLMDCNQLLFLNIERESFNDPDLLGLSFLEQLQRAGLAPSKTVLEVTERSSIKDFEVFRDLLRQLRRYGFRLAMDDVGAGYSGLQAIAELEPDFLKVDMTLVRDLHVRPVKRELIATIRRFTENTGTTLIAEGVETPEELASLVDLGVRCAQGYLFARPGDPPSAPDWTRMTIK